MTDVKITIITGIVSTILGGVIGVVGTYIGAVRIANRQRLLDAGLRLREAFQDEITLLQIGGNIDACHLLECAFKKHLIAVSEFKYILPKRKRVAFDQAWQQYHCFQGPPYIHFLEQYNTVGGRMEQREKNRQTVIQRLNHILSFTL